MATTRGRGEDGGVRRCVEGIGAGRVEGKRADGGWCEGRGKRGVGRVRVLSSRVDGLSFVGASTRPGNGVPLVLTSARLLCDGLSGELGLLKDS